MNALEIKYVSEWEDDLNWAPAQLTREFIDPKTGKKNELYCRWRHHDPWKFSIIQEPGRVFLGFGLTQADKIKDVHTHAEKLLFNYYSEHSPPQNGRGI